MAEDSPEHRLTCQEQFEIVKVPLAPGAGATQDGLGEVRRYMGKRAAWLPGSDLVPKAAPGAPQPMAKPNLSAFGGQVYSQSALAVCRAMREDEEKRRVPEEERQGLHVGWSRCPAQFLFYDNGGL